MLLTKWLKSLQRKRRSRSRVSHKTRPRRLRLTRLEERRVLNADFAFDLVDGLDLTGFDATQLDVTLDFSDDADNANDFFEFTLNSGMWNDLGSDAGASAAGDVLSVDYHLLHNLALSVNDTNDVDLAVVLNLDTSNLPGDGTLDQNSDSLTVMTGGDGSITVGGDGWETNDISLTGGDITISGELTADNGGTISANSPLTISADVFVGASTSFTAGDSALDNDDLTINSGATVTLTSATDATLTFTAGDDIIFDTGDIVTAGGGTHSVTLTADNEAGGADTDVGSVTQTGAAVSVTTNDLVIASGAGIGDAESPSVPAGDGTTADNALRIDVDSIDATNSTANDILLVESNDISILALSNSMADDTDGTTGQIDLDAGGTITLDAGGTGVSATDGDISLTATSATADVVVLNSIDTTSTGAISIEADDRIRFSAAGLVTAAGSGDVTVTANTDGAAGDSSDEILMAGAAVIDAGSGTISMSTSGAAGGDITLSLIRTTNTSATSVSVTANGSVLDADGAGGNDIVSAGIVTVTSATADIGAPGAGGDLFKDTDVDTLEVSGTELVVDAAGFAAFDFTDTDTPADADVTVTAATSLYLELTAADIDVSAFPAIADLVILTTGTITVADSGSGGLSVTNDLRLEAADIDATDSGTVLLTGDSVLVEVTTADDEILSVTLTDEQEFDFESSTSAHVLFNTAATITDLNCDGHGATTDGNTLAIDADGGTITQATAQVAPFDARIVTTNLLVLGDNDVHLCDPDNEVDVIAADMDGALAFADADGLTVGTIARVIPPGSVSGITTAANDVLLNVGATLDIDQGIDADTAGVRIVANGDITQNATSGAITADELGVRQESAADGSIILDAANVVTTFAADNSFTGGLVVFGNSVDLTIGEVAAQTLATCSFAVTTGIQTDDGDVLLNVTGSLDLDETINTQDGANTADVRIEARGDVTQAAAGVITTDSLGVSQEGPVGDILLGEANGVNTLAADNADPGGVIVFHATDDLIIGDVVAQAIDSLAFDATSGIVTDDGDILIDAGATLSLESAVDAGTQDVRLIADGDITQTAAGTITAAELGVRQESLGAADVVLDDANLVNTVAGINLFATGLFTFNNAQSLTIGTVSLQTIAGCTFAATDGVETTSGAISVTATGATSDLRVARPVASTGGSVSLSADDAVTILAAGDVSSDGGDVVITANAANSTGDGSIGPVVSADSLFMADGAVVDSGAGTILLTTAGTSGGSITLGRLVADNGGGLATDVQVVVTANGSIIDGGDLGGDDIEVTNGAAEMTSTTGNIGVGGGATDIFKIDVADIDPVEVSSTILEATADGVIVVDFTDNDGIDTDLDLVFPDLILNTDDILILVTGDLDVSGGLAGFGVDPTDNVAIILLPDGFGDHTLTVADVTGLTVGGDLRIDAAEISAVTVGTDVVLESDSLMLTTFDANAAQDPELHIITLNGDGLGGVGRLDIETVSDISVRLTTAAEITDLNCDGHGISTNGDLPALANSFTLDAIGGDITQDISLTTPFDSRILTADLILLDTLVSGSDFELCDPENDADTLTATVTGDVLFVDVNDLTLTGIVAGGSVGIEVGDDLTIDADVTSATGHVTLIAGDDIDQNRNILATAGTIYVLAQNDTADAISGIDMLSGTSTTATLGNIRLAADGSGDVLLSAVSAGAGAVSVLAEGSILDNNAAALNITAVTARLWADAVLLADGTQDTGAAGDGVGIIGGDDALNGTPTVNVNAIDIQVTTLAAQSADGIYVLDLDTLTIDATGDITVTRFDCDATNPPTQTDSSLADLTTTDGGPIKAVTAAGLLTVNDGDADGVGVSADGSGDVLLESRLGGDIDLNADVLSGSGHITIVSSGSIDSDGLIATGGTGSVYVNAAGTIGLAETGVTAVMSGSGDILIDSDGGDVTIDADVVSTSGDIIVIAVIDVNQNADITTGGSAAVGAVGDILMTAASTTATDVVLVALGNLTMDAASSVVATGNVVSTAGVDATLGSITGTNVALSAGGDILDGNTTAVNITATTASLRAGGSIGDDDAVNGTPAINDNAVDLMVGTVAALADDGIYLRQLSGTLTVDAVAAVTATTIADVSRVNFNSTTEPITVDATTSLGALEDLETTTDGPILVVNETDDITVNEGGDADGHGVSAAGSGDVLLESRSGGDVTLTADVLSGTGHITLAADGSVDSDGLIATAGGGTVYVTATTGSVSLDETGGTAVMTDTGDVLVESIADSVTIAADVTTTSGDVMVTADTDVVMSTATITATEVVLVAGTDIEVDAVVATNAGLAAGGDIIDANATLSDVNITATSASLRAGGLIGDADALNGTPAINDNAIDLAVTTVAALADDGIYLREVAAGGDLTVDAVAAVAASVDVSRVNFNSTTTAINHSDTIGALEDLETTTDGPIKVVADDGDVTIEEGGDGDGHGISAAGTGDVLVEAFAGDVVLNADVLSGTGNITIAADGSISSDGLISTGGGGTITVVASTGSVTLDEVGGTAVMSDAGDILIQSVTDAVFIDADVVSTAGDIGVLAGLDVDQTADITATAGNVLIDADDDLLMDGATTTGVDVILQAVGEIELAFVTAANAALSAGGHIIDINAVLSDVNITATTVSLRAGGRIGGADTLNGTPGVNDNAIELDVDTVAALSGEGTYLCEVDDIAVDAVTALTVTVDVNRVNFNSTTTPVSESETLGTLEDLETTDDGPIKLVAKGGTLTVNEGGDGDGRGVSAAGSGDVLLESRSGGDVILTADVLSGTGHITIAADGSVDSDGLITTAGTGTVYVTATTGSVSLDETGGTAVSSATGDVLVESLADSVTIAADITTAGGDVMVTAGTDVLMSTATITATEVVLLAGSDIELDAIVATNAGLSAGANITDVNTTLSDVNITAINASLRAGGLIGDADALNGTPAVNDNAIDLDVTRVAGAAADGIYLREVSAGGDLIIDAVPAIAASVDVSRVNFNSTTTPINHSDTLAALEDLETTAGPIKVVVEDGSLTVEEGGDGDGHGVNAIGSDILLEARGITADVTLNADVISDAGHITISAEDDVHVAANITTGGSGTVYVLAGNATDADVVAPGLDGINVGGDVTTVDGDILLESSQDVRLTESLTSTTGDIGVIAARDVVQEDDGDIVTGGTAFVDAGVNWTMSAGAAVTATGGDFVGMAAAGDISLGLITAADVGLSAGGDIIDANGAALNVDAVNLVMRAGGLIGDADLLNGTPGVNDNAIDTNVTTIAAIAADGVYVCEVDDLIIDAVAIAVVTVDVSRVNFNSTTTPVSETRSSDALEDVETTTDGPIKIVAKAGTLTVNEGGDGDGHGVSAAGSGDVLLETRGGGDVILTADVLSGTGHITIAADGSVDSDGLMSTAGTGSVYVTATTGSVSIDEIGGIGILTVDGDILVESPADSVTLDADVVSTSGDVGILAGIDVAQNADITTTGDVLVDAGADLLMSTAVTAADNVLLVAGSDVELDVVTATNVALFAGGDIIDVNAAAVNITAITANLVAGGLIGDADVGNGSPGTNDNAVDLDVDTLAARAGDGIYLCETNDIAIDAVAAFTVTVDVSRVNFNSTTTPVSESQSSTAREDLETTTDGPIKLVAKSGTLAVNEGGDADGHGVSAAGSGDVLLEARLGNDVVLAADVLSGTGHITIAADGSVDSDGLISTGGAGTVYVTATTGTVSIDEAGGTGIVSVDGDIFIESVVDSVTLDADVVSTSGDIGVQAGTDVIQNADVSTTSGNVLIDAGNDVLMSGATTSGSEVVVLSVGDIEVDAIVAANAALSAGGDIVDANVALTDVNITATTVSLLAGGLIGDADALNGTPGVNDNAIDLNVDTIAAAATSGIYLREVAAGGGLTVDTVAAVTVTVEVDRVNFNSTTSPVTVTETIDALEDLETTDDAPIKVVAESGTLTVNEGGDADGHGVSAVGGDVLLEARGASSDVVLNAEVISDVGHITINASDDVDINAAITTGGDGTVLVRAANSTAAGLNGIDMADGTSVTTDGGNVRMLADNEGDIRLGLVDVSGASVSLIAEGSILDANGSALNVSATALRMEADAAVSNAANGAGIIGGPDLANGTPDANENAIDTTVTSLAAVAADGIHVLESDGLTVEATGDISVEQVNFNSTTIVRTDASLSDLETTDNGDILLQSTTGTLTFNEGDDADNVTVSAHGTGNVLLQTLGAAADVVINGSGDPAHVSSDTGHVTVASGRDVLQNANMTTSGDIVVDAGRDIVMTAALTSGDNVIGTAGGEILLDRIIGSNVALNAGTDITDGNGTALNITATNLSMRAGGTIGSGATGMNDADPSLNDPVLSNDDAIDLRVGTVAASGDSGIFLREVAAGGSLTIGDVAAISAVRAHFNGTTSAETQAALDGAETSAGNIWAVTESGTLTVTDGADADSFAVRAGGDDAVVELVSLTGNAAINGDVGVAGPGGDADVTMGERIVIHAVDLSIGHNVTITTDDNDAAGASSDSTGDYIELDADGTVTFVDEVTIRTDGGVAKRFLAQPAPMVGSSAFFVFGPVNGNGEMFPSIENVSIAQDGLVQFLLNAFVAVVGSSGEENLRFDIDWRDPFNGEMINGMSVNDALSALANTNGTLTSLINDGNEITSDRYQTFFVDLGGVAQEFGHIYSADGGPNGLTDMAAFGRFNVTEIVVDFALSHHDSIQVFGSTVEQSGDSAVVDGGVISTSDNRDTGLNPLTDDLTTTRDGQDFSGTIDPSVDDNPTDGFFTPDDDNDDLRFETGLAVFQVPTIFTLPIIVSVEEAEPVFEPPQLQVQPPDILEPVTIQEELPTALTSTPLGTQDYYQLRRRLPGSDELEVLIDRIEEDEGDQLNSLEELEQLFRKKLKEPLQEGGGYELWLVTEDRARGIRIERPVFEFEITDGKPQADTDELESDMAEELELVPDQEAEPGDEELQLRPDVGTVDPGAFENVAMTEPVGQVSESASHATAAPALTAVATFGLASRRTRRKMFSAGARLRRRLERSK